MPAPPILLALAGNRALLPEHIDALLAINDPELSREVAREQRLTSAQIDRLAGSGQRDILVALIESGNLAVERIPNDDPWALLAAVDRGDAPDDLLHRLATWPDAAVRLALGEHASERLDIAQFVADDEDCSVAACAARLWELPEKLALRLSRRAEGCVRAALASNIHAPGVILAGLIGDEGEPGTIPCPHRPDTAAVMREVRLLAAGNPATPVGVVEPLTVGPDPTLALALAYRSDLRDETYRHLLELRDHNVIARVAMNWAAPPDLLRELYDLDAGRWRHCVLANPRTPLDLLVRYSREDGSPPTDNHPDLDGLLALARHADPRVRLVAAASHSLPADVRATLIEDADFEVANRATRFYAVSAEQVRRLVTRYGSLAFSHVAGHPACPPDVLLTIATDPTSSDEAIIDVAVHEAAPPAALAACLRHAHAAAGIAGNLATPPDILTKLASHSDPEVLWELARNPSLPATAGDLILKVLTTS
ncbi:hypothetical protein FHR83_005060 [Actinoplanes campanulatus]|uniref:Leucine rich repeat variant n=1 Tax=Actinoplanes campanulatus TaxID=113559 RepID=A0A7W5AJD8_9ACTN|nr:hypothetical protein [Actinoplanes campanulatus]MBB3097382.1 hypothetical protein [Actinoplanes campanulatus]GGN26589.1 hypothetical protein GCM10010109_43510 [Actinoplanes campanulatus]GID38156.1 hypothetical protein Aca09nite_46620 [Actinoplanes campanulatus]